MCHNSHIQKLSLRSRRERVLRICPWLTALAEDSQWAERDLCVTVPMMLLFRRLCTHANGCPHYSPRWHRSDVFTLQPYRTERRISCQSNLSITASVLLFFWLYCLVLCYTLHRAVCCSSGFGLSGVMVRSYTCKKCKVIQISGHFKMMFSSPEKCIEISITLYNKLFLKYSQK